MAELKNYDQAAEHRTAIKYMLGGVLLYAALATFMVIGILR